jgi:hypothetical protein
MTVSASGAWTVPRSAAGVALMRPLAGGPAPCTTSVNWALTAGPTATRRADGMGARTLGGSRQQLD